MARNVSTGHAIAMLLFLTSASADTQASTFRISQLYSNLDGSVQFVELTESQGLNGQHRLAGLSLTSTSDGRVKRFTFPHDLPTDRTAHMSIVVATSWLWVLDALSTVAPDVLGLPPRFVPTEGGTLEFAGVDRVTYGALLTDGVSAWYRDADADHATFPSNGRCPRGPPCDARFKIDQTEVFAIEYHHSALDHYFVSASAPDIDALDSGRLAGWTRTGYMLHVGGGRGAASGLAEPVCRFYIPPDEGDSHFLSASPAECEAVRSRFPRLMLESSAAFFVGLPDAATGRCGPAYWPGNAFTIDTLPVYRLWNGRRDSNHRYTNDFDLRQKMIERGYVSEGYGPLGVAMCVLPPNPWDY